MRQSLQGALRPRRRPGRAVPRLLAPRRGRRFRSLAVGLSDAGRGADRPRAALDGGAAGRSRPCSPGCSATCWAGSPATIAQSRTLRLAGVLAMAFHPIPYYIVAFLLLIVFGYLWPILPIGGGSKMNMPRDWSWEFVGSLRHPFHPAGSLPGAGRAGRLVHGHALAGLQHRHRGLRRLCRAGRRRTPAHPGLLRHAQRAGAAGHRPRHVAGRHLQRRHHHRAGVRLSRHRHAAGVGRLCRRLQPGAGHHHGVDRRRLVRGAADRPRYTRCSIPA